MTNPRPRTAVLQLVGLAAFIAAISFVAWRLGYFEPEQRARIIQGVGRVGGSPVAAAIYVAAYTLVVLLCLPATVVTVIGGALFGTVKGAGLTWTAALLGTAAAHAIAHSIGGDQMRRLFARHRLTSAIHSDASVMSLIRLRLIPVAPFGVAAYVAGLGAVKRGRLLVATGIGILPATLAYSFGGEQLRVGIADTGAARREALVLAGVVSAVVSGAAVASWIVVQRRSRRHS